MLATMIVVPVQMIIAITNNDYDILYSCCDDLDLASLYMNKFTETDAVKHLNNNERFDGQILKSQKRKSDEPANDEAGMLPNISVPRKFTTIQ